MEIQVMFWVVTPCSDVVGYHLFGGSCCLHLQGVALHGGIHTAQVYNLWYFLCSYYKSPM